jgi:DNA helicase-2/ATP-dependent DNA helicase PcrA
LRSIRTDSSPEKPDVSGQEAGEPTGFQVGDTVRHERFGRGRILSLEGGGSNAKAVISFEHSGTKSLLLKYAKLTAIKE